MAEGPVLELTLIEHAAMARPKGEQERILRETRVAPREDVIAKASDPHGYAFERLLGKGIVPIQAGHYVELADLPKLARGGVGSGFVEHYGLVLLPLAKHGLDALPTLFEVFTTWPENVLGALCFLEHPLLRHVARRLLWGTFEPGKRPKLVTPFRIAEDGTLANVDDDAFALALTERAAVGLVHPLLVTSEVRERFAATFTDYGIV